MRRFNTIILFLALSQYAMCNVITDRDNEDNPVQDAKPEENSVVVVPVEGVPAPFEGVAEPNTISQNIECAKIGEFCINHKDCCTNSCLGFMRRCVSGRELDKD